MYAAKLKAKLIQWSNHFDEDLIFMDNEFAQNWFKPQAKRLTFSRVIFLRALIITGHVLKQTKSPFKKYFPHEDQRLIGVEPRVWKQCGRNREICLVFKQI